jgi:hypothetical protein
VQKLSAGKFHFEPPYYFTSFNHLVGAGKNHGRDCQAKGLGSLEVDDELKLGWLHDRQVGRLFAVEDTAGIDTSLTMGAVRFIT